MTQFLDTRQAAILTALLQNDQAVPVHSLASRLNLTPRMVRYNLSMVSTWLAERGARLQASPRIGLVIKTTPEQRRELLVELQNGDLSLLFSTQDRLHLILFRLLNQPGYSIGATLEKELLISHATLARDMQRAEEWLRRHNLYLSRRPRLGTIVVGREFDMRHAAVSLLGEINLTAEMILLCLDENRSAAPAPLQQMTTASAIILNDVSRWPLQVAWQTVNHLQSDVHATFTGDDHLALTLYLALSIVRYSQGKKLDLLDEQFALAASLPEFSAVTNAAQRIKNGTGVLLPPDELAQFCLEVIAAVRSHSVLPRDNSSLFTANLTPQQIAAAFLERAGERLAQNLSNSEVEQRLTQHIDTSMLRILYGLPIHNPLAAQICQSFPQLWKTADEVIREITGEQPLAVPVEEIAYLTLYLAMAVDFARHPDQNRPLRVVVACPSIGVVLWMLTTRLEKALPGVQIQQVVSLHDIPNLDLRGIDAVISTAQMPSNGVPVITVSPLLLDEDIRLVRERLGLA